MTNSNHLYKLMASSLANNLFNKIQIQCNLYNGNTFYNLHISMKRTSNVMLVRTIVTVRAIYSSQSLVCELSVVGYGGHGSDVEILDSK